MYQMQTTTLISDSRRDTLSSEELAEMSEAGAGAGAGAASCRLSWGPVDPCVPKRHTFSLYIQAKEINQSFYSSAYQACSHRDEDSGPGTSSFTTATDAPPAT